MGVISDLLDEADQARITLIAERDRARLTAATLANRLWQAERLLITVIQPGTSHAQDEETGRLINIFLANGGNHHD